MIYRSRKAIYVEIDDDSEKLEQLHLANTRLYPQLARVYSLLPENLEWVEPINRQIARAVALNLADATHEAHEMLTDAAARVERLKLELA